MLSSPSYSGSHGVSFVFTSPTDTRPRPCSATVKTIKANASSTARRATAPGRTSRLEHDPHGRSSDLRTSRDYGSASSNTSPRAPILTVTSGALPVEEPHSGHEQLKADKEEEGYRSDAFGNGFRPLHPVFSHLSEPKGWYHIWNAPAGVAVEDAVSGSVEQQVDLLTKLKGVLGLGRKGSVERGEEIRGEHGGSKMEMEMQGLGVARGMPLGLGVESIDDLDETGDGCSESWRKRDARRYGLVGSFEFGGTRSS